MTREELAMLDEFAMRALPIVYDNFKYTYSKQDGLILDLQDDHWIPEIVGEAYMIALEMKKQRNGWVRHSAEDIV